MLNSYLSEKVRKIIVEASNGCGCTDVVNVILSVESLIKLSNLSNTFKMSTWTGAQLWQDCSVQTYKTEERKRK